RIAGIEEREARDLFDEARAVAERLQDRAGHAFLLTSYGRLCGLAGDAGQYLACAEQANDLAEGSDPAFEFEMRSVLAHAQLAVGRLAAARATAETALSEVAELAGLREAVGHSTALGLCRVWWGAAAAPPRLPPRSTVRTPSCARCCVSRVICPGRWPMAAAPPSSRRSTEARSLGWRPRRSSGRRSSGPGAPPPPH